MVMFVYHTIAITSQNLQSDPPPPKKKQKNSFALPVSLETQSTPLGSVAQVL